MRCCLQCVLSPCRRRRPSGNETAPVCMCQEAHHRSLSYQLQTTPTAELRINDSNTATNAHFTPPASRQCCLCRVRRCEFSRPDKCVLRRSASGGRTGSACAVGHTPTQNALVRPTQFTPPHQTRQDGLVCIVSDVFTSTP